MLFVLLAAGCGGRSGQLPDDAGSADSAAHPADTTPTWTDQTTAGCLEGSNFVHCPGAQDPALFCAKASYTACRWVSNGKPWGRYKYKTKPECGYLNSSFMSLTWFLLTYGDKPWTRDRGMTLKVKVDPSAKAAATSVTCSSCASPWNTVDTPCNTQVVARASMPGTYLMQLFISWHAGWRVEVEVDTKASPPRARLCRIPFTDNISCFIGKQFPDCADSGSVTLDAPRMQRTTTPSLAASRRPSARTPSAAPSGTCRGTSLAACRARSRGPSRGRFASRLVATPGRRASPTVM